MKTKPYGSWKSPISGKSLVQSSLRLGQIQIDDGSVYWTEGRPAEKGRTALMIWTRDGVHEITAPEIDVRSRVHEYGGGAFLCQDERKFYIKNTDQQIYELLDTGESNQVSNNLEYRFADMIIDSSRNLLYAIGENHSDASNVQNCLVKINLDGGKLDVISAGHDFYSNPQLSPANDQLLFLTWDHPNMPWDGTELHLARLHGNGSIEHSKVIAGGNAESIFQPTWDPDGRIYYVSDISNWWNIYSYENGKSQCVLEMKAEFGLPQWVFGMSRYTVLNSGDLLATYTDLSGSKLVRIDANTGRSTEIPTPYVHIDQVRGSGNLIAFIGSRHSEPAEIVCCDLGVEVWTPLQSAASTVVQEAYISKGEPVSFESAPGELTHAWYYPPTNPEYKAPSDERPPLIVLSHGGPTGNSSRAFNLAIQYWTTRGFAIVDVNYSGSTEYGRKYRERLNSQWGIRDVEDCTAAANFLADEGLADPERLIIKGGSAGGYTTLAALTFTDTFRAGASYYGIGDLTLLAKDTHKFESRYLDSLVGSYPEQKELYFERSPLNFADQLDCPVIFLQGLDDKVVPPNQAEGMVSALKSNGIPVAYLTFEGESHGFRQSSTVIRAIESEYYFYSRVFDLELEDSLEPMHIHNLD